jgi:hypothetical protein
MSITMQEEVAVSIIMMMLWWVLVASEHFSQPWEYLNELIFFQWMILLNF